MRRRALLGGLISSTSAQAEGPRRLSFDALYKSFGIRGLVFADDVAALSGKSVTMAGYMAPPLKAESSFFVLALCPFCQSDADWPLDIVVVYLRRVAQLVDAGVRIDVAGRLEAGSWTDPESGFVSQLRIVDATFRAR